MKCNRCGRDMCRSLFEHVRDDRTASLDWFATARAFEDCAEAAAKRALRAEAELAALNGRPEALTPYLPDGWTWDATCCEWHGPGGLYVTEDGALGRDKPGAHWPDRRSDGLLAVMVDAVADVVAAEGEL